ncbi:MAG TPA: GGDEF domain-containing protein [Polyangia bacterium]
MSSLNELGLARPLDRHRFEAQLGARVALAEHQQRRFSVVLVAADSLAWINRRWGRPAGDSVLRKLGRRVLASLAMDDLFARYDGNRFGIVRWAASLDRAVAFAQHLLGRIANTPFDIPDSNDAAFLTASIGVALGETGAQPPALIAAVEQALRRAKDAGGNRVCTT